MGEGLKRVAKQCGGLTAISGKTVIRYDADGNRRPTPLDDFLAAAVREAEERAEMIRRGQEFIGAETCSYGEAHRLRQCDCEWLDNLVVEGQAAS